MLETQNQIFSVVMSADVARRARVVAALQGKSRSRLLRDILTDYLKQYDDMTQADPDLTRIDTLPMQETKQEGMNVTG